MSDSDDAPSLLTSFTYGGMEVLFCSSKRRVSRRKGEDDGPSFSAVCYGICARTQYVFQPLELPSTANIVALQSCPVSGQVIVAHADGKVQAYSPVAVDPTCVAFGRYRWWPTTTAPTGTTPTPNNDSIFRFDQSTNAGKASALVDCAALFYPPGTTGMEFGGESGKPLLTSLSHNGKLLLAHGNQLALVETATSSDAVLWMTRLPAKVVTAKLSGDGHAIAVVLEKSPEGSAPPAAASSDIIVDDADGADGVYTFERDWDDGSDMDRSANSSSGRGLQRRRSSAIGILYKPGPFLVHTAPVTKLAFRGLGHETSSCKGLSDGSNGGDGNGEQRQGNDLLLTYSASNCTARIFGQNCWRPLTDWQTPSNTRVDWVKGVAAFTLGDLESQKKPAQPKSAASSRLPSAANSVSSAEDSSLAALNETLGRRSHFQSIPSHSAPLSNAGAWVTEVTFQGDLPTVRLSRLTYLKRGVDDLNPTLFEVVSAFLPTGSILADRVLADDGEQGLSVEAIWPAWNPWLSKTSDLDSQETLRGSAMNFLGLSSGPGVSAGGGFFGDSQLGSTQSPPAEIRMVASHPVTGQVILLDMPLFADRYLSSIELGSPRRSVLSLSTVTASFSGPERWRPGTIRSASLDYDSSRLVANISNESNAISVTWRRPGTMSLLPSNWRPEDVEPSSAENLLSPQSTTRLTDDSVIPVPLALPPLRVPADLEGVKESEAIRAVFWWPESTFGGSRLVLAVLSSGTIVVFEVAPPWGTNEPKLPASLRSEAAADAMEAKYPIPNYVSSREDNRDDGDEYEVPITPDPDYGLGLRLESQVDGMPAVAGSFKKHPITGESLPAEKTGLITLGDELMSANGVSTLR